MLNDLAFRLRTLFRRSAAEDDLDDELRFHLERSAEQHVTRGLSAREARRRARLEFGQVDVVKDDCRESWGIRQLDALHQDVVYALRLIRKHPALSAVAAVSLAIGIGLNTALFALLDATVLRRLPVAHPEQLVDVYTSDVDGFSWYGSSYPDYLDLRRGTRTLTGLLGYVPSVGAVRIGDRTRPLTGEAVTGNYFQLLGVPAALGRALLPEDDRPGSTPAVVISTGLWSDLFGDDPEVIGRSLWIGGRSYTVVGVAPESFGGLTPPILTPAFWIPMTWIDDVQPTVMHNGSPAPGATRLQSRGLRWLLVKGRLRNGDTAAGAADDLNGVMQMLEEEYPDSNEGLRATVIPTGDVSTHPVFEDRLRAGAASLLVLLGLVLLIGCANVAGLLLARASARRREIGLRLAVGASRGRLLRQLLVESVVLALFGVTGGIALAWGLLEGLGAVPVALLVPVALDLSLNGRVLALSVVVAMGAGITAGLMPGWTGTRSSVLADLAGRAPAWSLGSRRWSLREALVALQIAVCLVLLVVAGLLGRNLSVASRIDPGFRADEIASVTVGLGLVGYGENEAARFLERARERVRELPGVQAVAHADRSPLSINFNQAAIGPADGRGPDAPPGSVETVTVSEEYFDALGAPILEGRPFDTAIDTPGSPRVAIVNEALARRWWPGTSAVGRRIQPGGRGSSRPPVEIVGVVRDYKVRFLQEPPTPYVHYAASQGPGMMDLVPVLLARTAGDAGALGARMQEELRAVDPDIVFWQGLTLRDNVASQLLPAQLLAVMLGAAGLVAVWLAAIGLYGVIAYAIVRRTQEIGIRLALGATHRDVLGLVARQGALVVGIGAVLGSAAAFAAARATAGVLFGIDPADALAWGGALVVLVAVGVLAHAVPALHAVRVAPSTALRSE
ncbi:MAG: ABC transporter permease [Acidobacteria bacterium]|nr:ABC transporter permease [Acidobacteriota bacterium]